MPPPLLRDQQSSNRSFGTSGMNDQFVAAVKAIYDAAPDPSRWPYALDLIGECFGDQDVNLFWQRDDGSRGVIPSTGFNREAAFEYNSGNGFVVTGGRLSAASTSDQSALKSALLSMLCASPADFIDDPGPILIRRPNSERPLVTYILPLRDSHADALAQFLVSAKAIVLVVDPEPSEPPDPAIVRDILGLTLGEARLTALVGSGMPPREAAQKLQISENTARSVLKRVFAKVGVSRQSELSALLTRLALR
jgi:DNA-binding CsgD family transcriptional regulator